jgi:hypothetical protein
MEIKAFTFFMFLTECSNSIRVFLLKKLINEKYKIEFFCFLQKKADIQADPCIFFTVHRHNLLLLKISENER